MTTFDIISDTHFDFYKDSLYSKNKGKYTFYQRNFFFREPVLDLKNKRDFVDLWKSWKPKSKHLLIAGDIGHDNAENALCLKYLREEFYDTICLVIGNHDLYLVDYESKDSLERLKDFKEKVNKLDSVFLLDGSIVYIEDVRVGGAMGWYDGSFIKSKTISQKNHLWYNSMNDSRYVRSEHLPYPLAFDTLHKIEYPKLEYIADKSDIILSHINPSNQPIHQDEDFVHLDSTGFYSFDGSRLLKSTTAKHWVYGHTHSAKSFKINKTKIQCNPRGYPWQNEKFLIKQVKI